MISFKLTGNWAVTGQLLKGLPRDLKSAGNRGQKKAAELIVKVAKKHLRSQDLGWAPVSESSRKKGSRILIGTGDYYRAIETWKRGSTYFAGVKRSTRNSKGVQIYIYALVHEYGSGNIPKRPLWRPTYKEVGNQKGLQKIIKQEIVAKLTKLRNRGFSVKW